MFELGYVYKNKKTGKQFIPTTCNTDVEGNVSATGYYLVDKKDDDVILSDAAIDVKKKEYDLWEKTYQFIQS